MRRTCAAIILMVALAHSPPSLADEATGRPVVRVAAAISLRDALAAIEKGLRDEADWTVEFSFGSSGQLLEQIRNGAPFDVYIPAATQQLDVLARESLLAPGTRMPLAGNRLVLIVPADSANAPTSFEDLAKSPPRLLAIGEPATVPAGAYARQALEKIGAWVSLHDRLVFGKNVRQVLDYVERAEVDAGIVYATDAKAAGGKVRVCAAADPAWHEPIVYQAAVLRNARSPDAAGAFVNDLRRPEAQEILAELGFVAAAEAEPAAPPADAPTPTPAASRQAP